MTISRLQLACEREEIKECIGRINELLTQIDYNPGCHIRFEAETNLDADIRRVLVRTEELNRRDDHWFGERSVSRSAVSAGAQVRGREAFADLDWRWTSNVIDVRNWFVFAASERWREDDTEHEHYADSGIKSGIKSRTLFSITNKSQVLT